MDALNFPLDFIRLLFWALVIVSTLGVLIYTGSRILLHMKDLEPVRKKAQEISNMPEHIKAVEKDIGAVQTSVDVLKGEVSSLDTRVSSLDTRVSSLDTRVSSLENEVASSEERVITAVLKAIDTIPEKIVEKYAAHPFTQSKSPISLNDKGEKLAKDMNASDIASKYKERLTLEAKAENKGPYQIQQSCFNFASNEILKDLEEKEPATYDHLANVAYNTGVQLGVLMHILGLVLRDQVLEAVGQPSTDSDQNIKTSDMISKKT